MPPRIGSTTTQNTLRAAFGTDPFTAHQARGVGVTRYQLESAYTADKIHRLKRGVYIVDEPPRRTLFRHHHANLEARSVPSVLGERSAAEVWRIPVLGRNGPLPPSRPTFWVPAAPVRPGLRGGIHYIVGDIPARHRVVLDDGLVVTNPLRTAIDVVRLERLSRPFALPTLTAGLRRQWAIDEGAKLDDEAEVTRAMQEPAMRQRYTDLMSLMLAEIPRWGRRSVVRCLPDADPRLETALEALSWGRFIEAGVPLPIPQVWLQGSSGRWYRVDFWWPNLGLIGEADGMGKYGEVAALHSEKVRHLDLEAPGRTVLRWGWSHVITDDDPLFDGVLARIHRGERRLGA